VHSPAFENGIVKVQLEQMDDILGQDCWNHSFKAISQLWSHTSLSAQALSRIIKRQIATKFCLWNIFHPRLTLRKVSAARMVLTDYRKSMDPYTFECFMYLKVNRSKWDINLVSRLVGKWINSANI
jgi:hypothetical protein